MGMNGPGPAMHRVLDVDVEASDGVSIPVRVLVPVAHARAVVVYYHGGGWVAGSIDESETIARKLAERTSCAFVLVGYRLAPEHPYPAAVDDSYAALEWASKHVRDIAGLDVPLMVAGDDAGGNLAAVVALRARDEDGPPIGMQILICPLMDAHVEESSYNEPDTRSWLGPEAVEWFWEQYLPDLTARSEPASSPLGATDLSDLPPAVVVTAEHSPVRAGGEAYAQRLQDAGVTVNAQRYDGQIHGFFTLLMLPQGEKAFQQVIKAVRAYCARSFQVQT